MHPITLSSEQLQQYHEHGYVLLGKIMDDATLELLRAEEKRFREALPVTEKTVFRSQLGNYSQPIRRFCSEGAHIEAVKQIVGPDVSLWFNQFVTKMPDSPPYKSEFPWHQDNGYVGIEPATNVTVWCALDDVNEDNGCVWVMPDSHQGGLLPHDTKGDSWHLEVPVEGDGVPAIMKAGEAIAFNGLTLHRSKLNLTGNARRAFFSEYCRAEAIFTKDRTPVFHSPDAWIIAGQLPWPTQQ